MTDSITVETYTPYRDIPQRTGSTVITLPRDAATEDQVTIQQNIAAAKTALQQATQTVNGATSATALAALQGYVQANNQAWNALLPALKYIAQRLAS